VRILIVEDDPVLADGLTRSLRQADFAVDCVHDGDAADHTLTAQAYDLVILDLGLPGMSGLEFLSWLRQQTLLAPTPVIVLTASPYASDVSKAYELGAKTFFAKPLASPDLDRILKLIVDYWSASRLPTNQSTKESRL